MNRYLWNSRDRHRTDNICAKNMLVHCDLLTGARKINMRAMLQIVSDWVAFYAAREGWWVDT